MLPETGWRRLRTNLGTSDDITRLGSLVKPETDQQGHPVYSFPVVREGRMTSWSLGKDRLISETHDPDLKKPA